MDKPIQLRSRAVNTYSHCRSNSYCYCNTHRYSDGYVSRYRDRNTDLYSQTFSDSEAEPDIAASPNTGASTVGSGGQNSVSN